MFCCIPKSKFNTISDIKSDFLFSDVYINDRVLSNGITAGCWPLICEMKDYQRENWPLPFYKCIEYELLHDPDPPKGFEYIVQYDEFQTVTERRQVTVSQYRNYCLPGYTDAEAIEKIMTLLFEEGLSREISEIYDT